MISEVKIIVNEKSKGQKNYVQGDTFERLIRTLLEHQQYEISQNVNFSGLEIDLLAKHKFDSQSLYVECKAKKKVDSTELKNFGFIVMTELPDKAYFIHTIDLDHQVKGLQEKTFQSTILLNKVTFFGPEKIISFLQEIGKIKNIDTSKIIGTKTKQYFITSPSGDFFIYIVNPSLTLPKYFYVFNAQDGRSLDNIESINSVIEEIPELEKLEFKTLDSSEKVENLLEDENFDIVAELQESEDWYDYKPASSKYFVGRDSIRTRILHFFDDVFEQNTSKRVFYLEGKSGWGKSSIVAELRSRCRNKSYRNKFFLLAVDSRSASSGNFIASSLKLLIEKATKSKFIDYNYNIDFTSSYELLKSTSIQELLNYLQTENKILILVFDQFEDVFRKEKLFKFFYKFLTDVTSSESNLIVGFSWKTEFLIQGNSPSYYWWQQAKDQAKSFTVPEFGAKEIKGIINQLDKAIRPYNSKVGKLSRELKDKLNESSQGFPWLIKKLCIHVFNQVIQGKRISDLSNENLNIKELFEADLEILDGEEVKTLEFIARKSLTENLFDEKDVNERGLDNSIKSLLDKRLIIRSGYNYNIYWDIFRDYITEKKVPVIGRSYLHKQSVNTCLRIFLTFRNGRNKSFDDIVASLKTELSKGTVLNGLNELRNLELIKKSDKSDNYVVSDNIEVTENGFKNHITNQIKNYTTYIKLIELQKEAIEFDDILIILQNSFKGLDFSDNTWKQYVNYYINWISHTDLPLKNNLVEPKKGRGGYQRIDLEKERSNYTFFNSPSKVAQNLAEYFEDNLSKKLSASILSDLRFLGIIELKGDFMVLSIEGQKLRDLRHNNDEFRKQLSTLSLKLPKIKEIISIIRTGNRITAKTLIKEYPNIINEGLKQSSRQVYASNLISWGRYNLSNSESHRYSVRPGNKEPDPLLYYSPEKLIAYWNKQNGSISDRKGKYVHDLKSLNIIDEHFKLTQNGQELLLIENAVDKKKKFIELAYLIPKMKLLSDFIEVRGNLKAKSIIEELSDLFEEGTKQTTKIVKISRMKKWINIKKDKPA